jgi:hypothetical protein
MTMKRILVIATMAVCCAISCTISASAQVGGTVSTATAAGSLVAPAATFSGLLNAPESQMVSLVKAMPADKFGFAPSAAIFVPSQKTEFTGVRTFGALVVHVAQANYGLGGRIGGPKPTVDMAALAKLTDKDQIVAALEASFAYVHTAIGTLTPENVFESAKGPMPDGTRGSMAAFVAVHTSDEYGQMVEYLRMNGMVPPASVKK